MKPRTPRRRWPWIVLAAVVAALIVAALAIPALLDIERYRGRIEQALRDATGWDAEVGELDLSLFRGLALTASPARLRSPTGGSSIDVETVVVRAGLAPLFRGELEIRHVGLVRPTIELVRPGPDASWDLPLPPATEGAPAAEPEGAGSGGFRVSIDSVSVDGGTLRLVDRSTDPPLRAGIVDLELDARPDEGTVEGSARLEENGASLSWSGTFPRTLAVEIGDLPTEALAVVTGEEVLRPGGTIDAEASWSAPGVVTGTMTLENAALASGEAPLGSAVCRFAVRSNDAGWAIDELVIESGQARITGTGTVVPLAIDLVLPPTPLGDAVTVARAIFPLSLDLEEPGQASALVRLRTRDDGELAYSAEGEVSAAAFRAGDLLPPAEGLRAAYALDPAGALEVRILGGRVAGGPITGTLRTASVSPLAPVRFEGEVNEAALGGLLAGFVDRAADAVRGPADVRSSLSIDLSDETFVPADLKGKLALDVRQVFLPGWDLEAEIREAVREKLGALADVAGRLDERLADRPEAAAGDEKILDSLVTRLDFDSTPWRLETLELVTGGLHATGAGSFDATSGEVALDLTATLDRATTERVVGRLEELAALTSDGRLRLPLRIRGPMLSPSVSVDAGGVLAGKLEAETGASDVKGAIRGLLRKEIRERLEKEKLEKGKKEE
jgi:hypothetical protein